MKSSIAREVARHSVADRSVGKGSSPISRQAASQLPSRAIQASAALTIGKVAKLAQVSVDTIRYYEKEGLLSPAQKSGAGYRLYHEDAVRRLNFIRHAQHCGLSLSEIRELLELQNRDDSCCNDVRSLAIQKKLQLENKIKSLKAMSQALNELIDVCTGDRKPLDECPILAALESSISKQHHDSR